MRQVRGAEISGCDDAHDQTIPNYILNRRLCQRIDATLDQLRVPQSKHESFTLTPER